MGAWAWGNPFEAKNEIITFASYTAGEVIPVNQKNHHFDLGGQDG